MKKSSAPQLAFRLLANERVLWSGRPPLRAVVTSLLRPGSWFLFFALLMPLLLFPLMLSGDHRRESRVPEKPGETVHQGTRGPESTRRDLETVVVTVLVAGGSACLLWGLILAGQSQTSRYVLTTQRAWIGTGLLWRSERTSDLDKIVSVSVKRSPLQRILQLSSIELSLSGLTIHAQYSWLSQFTLYDIPSRSPLPDLLLNAWLPRDNPRGEPS